MTVAHNHLKLWLKLTPPEVISFPVSTTATGVVTKSDLRISIPMLSSAWIFCHLDFKVNFCNELEFQVLHLARLWDWPPARLTRDLLAFLFVTSSFLLVFSFWWAIVHLLKCNYLDIIAFSSSNIFRRLCPLSEISLGFLMEGLY